MDTKGESELLQAKPDTLIIKLEDSMVLHCDPQHEMEFAMRYKDNTDMCNYKKKDIKMEIKQEDMSEDGTTEIKQQPEIAFVSIPMLQINKEETVMEKRGIVEDIPSSESPRLTTEAEYLGDNGTCTSLTNSDLGKACCQMRELASDYKTKCVCTVLEKNISENSSVRQNICPLNCNPAHISDHYSKNSEPLSEFITPSNSDLESELARHSRSCQGSTHYKCEICEKSFKDSTNLKRHISYHSCVKQFKCDRCEKSFKLKSHLKVHILYHGSTKAFKCNSCEKSFKSDSDLKRHILCHLGKKPFKCGRCEKSYTIKSNLKRHELCHSDMVPYICEKCDKSFKHKWHLKEHILSHSNKRYKCDSCETNFKNKSNLIRHTLCHTGAKPYKCDICEKSYRLKSYLEAHILSHLDIKPYKCNLCEKSFNDKSNLIRHTLSLRHKAINA